MRKYIIERELPAISSAERQALKEAAQKSNSVLKELGPDIQWVESYVAGDKTFCVYLAQNEEIINEHSRRSGFPSQQDYRSPPHDRPNHRNRSLAAVSSISSRIALKLEGLGGHLDEGRLCRAGLSPHLGPNRLLVQLVEPGHVV